MVTWGYSTPPVAIEAYWANDRTRLYVAVVAIVEQPSWRHPRYDELELARFSVGADHAGPGWPEAARATELGERLSRELAIPFHFAARERPDDEVARWWHRGQRYRCDDCGLELDQNPAVHWFGMCYACHLAREERLPRLHVDLRRDVGAREYEQIWRAIDAALHVGGAGCFHAGSRIAGAQTIAFLTNNARRAAELAIRELRDAGLLELVRLRAAASLADAGEVVWPVAPLAR
jgi:hypothetical protein